MTNGLVSVQTQDSDGTILASKELILATRLYAADNTLISWWCVLSTTGLLLLALRDGRAMGALLVVHLGFVLALFLTLPYGKFVHGIYRTAALVQYGRERSTWNP